MFGQVGHGEFDMSASDAIDQLVRPTSYEVDVWRLLQCLRLQVRGEQQR